MDFGKVGVQLRMDVIPNISDSYLIVIGIAEPLLSAKLGKASCENGLFFTEV